MGTIPSTRGGMELQNWDSADYDRTKRVMTRAIPPTVLGIVLIIIAAFSGGFTMIQMLPPTAHLILATAGFLGQVPIIFWQYTIITENGRILADVEARLKSEGARVVLKKDLTLPHDS